MLLVVLNECSILHILDESTLKNLFELRLILEMGMADFLFERKTQKDMDELEEIVTFEEDNVNNESFFSLDKEIAFHGKLYQMSNNETLQKFHKLLLRFLNLYIVKLLKNGDNLSTHQVSLLPIVCLWII